ncbi:hypothetical protein, partial [Klebsiella pneumoniae]|uniref:hypothetical protein n=1 Tax=Klebsiella pneumoniae TaxID=573 RepID=UPI0025A22369
LRPIGDDKGSLAKSTLDALRLVITTTPVIVTSGTADDGIIRDVMLYRWAYVDKEKASFEEELEAAIRDQFDDSGG